MASGRKIFNGSIVSEVKIFSFLKIIFYFSGGMVSGRKIFLVFFNIIFFLNGGIVSGRKIFPFLKIIFYFSGGMVSGRKIFLSSLTSCFSSMVALLAE